MLASPVAPPHVAYDSSYQMIMHYIDTDPESGEYERNRERRRYRDGPAGLPHDDLQPTYYVSPWTKSGKA